MSTISKSHIINKASEAELQKLFPLTHFIVREFNPDYHIDYLIELNQENEPSGICFYVQLKGIENVHITKNNIKCSLKTKHLCYYLDKVKEYPVFLFVNDNTTTNTYWLFIQKHLKDSITNTQWRKQQKLTLSITKENLINDLDIFQNIVKEAKVYMKELWPSSVRAAAKKEIEFLESLDPRFKVKSFIFTENKSEYEFQTTEDCNINFVFKDGINVDELLNNPQKEKFIFKTSDIQIEGSELFNALLKKTENIILDFKKPSYVIDLILSRNNLNFEVEKVFLKGKVSVFNGVFEIECTLNDSPLKVKSVYDPASKDKPSFDFNFDFTNWIGRPINLLPYANKLCNIFLSHEEGDKLIYKVEFVGNPLIVGSISLWHQKDFNDYINSALVFYDRIKLINSKYNLNLNFPDLEKLKKSDLDDIDELYSLLVYNEYQIVGKTLTVKLKVKNNRNLLTPFVKNSAIRIVTGFEFNILGKKVKLDKMAVEIKNPKFTLSHTEFEELLQSKDEFILLELIADKDSKIVYRLIEEEIKIVEGKGGIN